MKKIKSFILATVAFALVAPAFTACSSSDDDNKKDNIVSEYTINDEKVAAQKAASKKDVAVLLVAFGSTWDNAFKAFDKTIDAYKAAFPNADVYMSFSSDICINRASAGAAICCTPLVRRSTARFMFSRCRSSLVRSLLPL